MSQLSYKLDSYYKNKDRQVNVIYLTIGSFTAVWFKVKNSRRSLKNWIPQKMMIFEINSRIIPKSTCPVDIFKLAEWSFSNVQLFQDFEIIQFLEDQFGVIRLKKYKLIVLLC